MNLKGLIEKGRSVERVKRDDLPNWNKFLQSYLAERKKVKPNKEGMKEVRKNDR